MTPDPTRQDLPDPSGAPPERGRIEGWPEWAELVRAAVAEAAATSSSLWLQDDDFAHWPIGERACVESFDQWVLSGRQVHATLVALRWDGFVKAHPRWLRWRTTWVHKVDCLVFPEDQISSLEGFRPTLVVKDRLLMQLLDAERGVGVWTRNPASLQAAWHQCDAISQRSLDSGVSTTLGL